MAILTIRRVIGSGLVLLAATACSGGANPSPTDESASGEAVQRLESDPAASPSGDSHEGHRHWGREKGDFMKRFDANEDGQIQLSELPPKMQEHMGAADTNHDGVLSKDELQAFHAQAKQERFARLDTNGDGTISDEERAAARAEFEKEHFARKDKNGDGVLTEAEIGERAWEHMKVADADGNGSLTLAEIEQATASGTLSFGRHGHHCDGDRNGTPPTKS